MGAGASAKARTKSHQKDAEELSLIAAVIRRDVEEVVRVLTDQPKLNVNTTDQDGNTALMLAVSFDQPEIVRCLLDCCKIDVNKTNKNGFTALMIAVSGLERVSLDIVISLLQHRKIDVRKKDEFGSTALHLAALEGRVDVLKELIKHSKIDINNQNLRGDTALLFVSEKGLFPAAQLLLLMSNIDVNKANKKGCTPLIKAAELNKTNILSLLVKHPDINLTLTEETGLNALNMAVVQGHLQSVKMILENRKSSAGDHQAEDSSAFLLAVSKGHTDVALLLLNQFSAHPRYMDKEGRRCLEVAAGAGWVETIHMLLKHEKIRDQPNSEDENKALLAAAKSGHFEIVEILLSRPKININLHGEDGFTALMWAAKNDNEKIVKLLLDHTTVDVNIRSKYPRSGGNSKMKVQKNRTSSSLVQSKTQTNPDEVGRTAIELSFLVGHVTLFHQFCSHPSSSSLSGVLLLKLVLQKLDRDQKFFPPSLSLLVGVTTLLLDGKFSAVGVTVLPDVVFQLRGLQRLDLRSADFSALPEAVQGLVHLEELYIPGTLFKGLPLSSLAALRKLRVLECYGIDAAAAKIPPEIIGQGSEAVAQYVKDLGDPGATENREVLLMFVGDGEAGKTSTLRSLRNTRTNTAEAIGVDDRTVGIDITQFCPCIEESPLTFAAWDFGGQAVYAVMQQLFMSRRAIYPFLWRVLEPLDPRMFDTTAVCDNCRQPLTTTTEHSHSSSVTVTAVATDTSDAKAETVYRVKGQGLCHAECVSYESLLRGWLQRLQFQVPGVSVVLVATHADCVSPDEVERQCRNIAKIVSDVSVRSRAANDANSRNKRGSLHIYNEGMSLAVSNISGVGIAELRNSLRTIAEGLDIYGERMPGHYVHLRERLRGMQKHSDPTNWRTWLSWDQYVVEAMSCGFPGEGGSLGVATKFFHETGVLRYFGTRTSMGTVGSNSDDDWDGRSLKARLLDDTVFPNPFWVVEVLRGLIRHDHSPALQRIRRDLTSALLSPREAKLLRMRVGRLTQRGILHRSLLPYIWEGVAGGSLEQGLDEDEFNRLIALLQAFNILMERTPGPHFSSAGSTDSESPLAQEWVVPALLAGRYSRLVDDSVLVSEEEVPFQFRLVYDVLPPSFGVLLVAQIVNAGLSNSVEYRGGVAVFRRFAHKVLLFPGLGVVQEPGEVFRTEQVSEGPLQGVLQSKQVHVVLMASSRWLASRVLEQVTMLEKAYPGLQRLCTLTPCHSCLQRVAELHTGANDTREEGNCGACVSRESRESVEETEVRVRSALSVFDCSTEGHTEDVALSTLINRCDSLLIEYGFFLQTAWQQCPELAELVPLLGKWFVGGGAFCEAFSRGHESPGTARHHQELLKLMTEVVIVMDMGSSTPTPFSDFPLSPDTTALVETHLRSRFQQSAVWGELQTRWKTVPRGGSLDEVRYFCQLHESELSSVWERSAELREELVGPFERLKLLDWDRSGMGLLFASVGSKVDLCAEIMFLLSGIVQIAEAVASFETICADKSFIVLIQSVRAAVSLHQQLLKTQVSLLQLVYSESRKRVEHYQQLTRLREGQKTCWHFGESIHSAAGLLEAFLNLDSSTPLCRPCPAEGGEMRDGNFPAVTVQRAEACEIFVSHTKEGIDAAEVICAVLETSNLHARCVSSAEIESEDPGDKKKKREECLTQCKLMICCLDKQYAEDPTRETEFLTAHQHRGKVVPVILSGYSIGDYSRWWPQNMPFLENLLFVDLRSVTLDKQVVRDLCVERLMPAVYRELNEWQVSPDTDPGLTVHTIETSQGGAPGTRTLGSSKRGPRSSRLLLGADPAEEVIVVQCDQCELLGVTDSGFDVLLCKHLQSQWHRDYLSSLNKVETEVSVHTKDYSPGTLERQCQLMVSCTGSGQQHQRSVEEVLSLAKRGAARTAPASLIPCPRCVTKGVLPPFYFSRDLCLASVGELETLSCRRCREVVPIFDLIHCEVFLSYNWGPPVCRHCSRDFWSANLLQTDGFCTGCGQCRTGSEVAYQTQLLVTECKTAVEDAAGVQCWQDLDRLSGGKNLTREMEHGVRCADVVVLFLTDAYSRSKNCMVEYLCSTRYGKYVIPVLLPGYSLSSAVKAGGAWWPEQMGALQQFAPVLLLGESQWAAALKEIADRVQTRMHRAQRFATTHDTVLYLSDYHSWRRTRQVFLDEVLRKAQVGDVAFVDQTSLEKVLAELFGQMDSDGSGYLDLHEVSVFFDQSGLGLSTEQVMALLGEADLDSDGLLSLMEFQSAVLAVLR